jgi:hypothetical protein
VLTKTSLMLGLGETTEEVIETMDDLRAIGVDIVTFGQYLRPTVNHLPVERYVTPRSSVSCVKSAWKRVSRSGLRAAGAVELSGRPRVREKQLRHRRQRRLRSEALDAEERERYLERLAALLEQARVQRRTLTYLEVADALAMPAPQRIHKTTRLLEILLKRDAEAGRPIRSALVTSRTRPGRPAAGFFDRARRLGLFDGRNRTAFMMTLLVNCSNCLIRADRAIRCSIFGARPALPIYGFEPT